MIKILLTSFCALSMVFLFNSCEPYRYSGGYYNTGGYSRGYSTNTAITPSYYRASPHYSSISLSYSDFRNNHYRKINRRNKYFPPPRKHFRHHKPPHYIQKIHRRGGHGDYLVLGNLKNHASSQRAQGIKPRYSDRRDKITFKKPRKKRLSPNLPNIGSLGRPRATLNQPRRRPTSRGYQKR